MKKLAVALCTLSFTVIFAQKVADYQYISLPEKFESFKNDNYGLDKALRGALTQKKYTVLPVNRSEWPAEANQNPCSVLLADVINDSGMLRNKVLLQFKDCNTKIVASHKGASSIKEFEAGFQDALKQAMTAVPASAPTEHHAIEEPPAFGGMMTKAVEVKEEPSAKNDATSPSSGAEVYTNQGISFQKVQLSTEQFILTDQSSSPFATFKATTKKDVYRVKFRNGQSSIAYFENGNLIIEMPLSEDSYLKQVFQKK